MKKKFVKPGPKARQIGDFDAKAFQKRYQKELVAFARRKIAEKGTRRK